MKLCRDFDTITGTEPTWPRLVIHKAPYVKASYVGLMLQQPSRYYILDSQGQSDGTAVASLIWLLPHIHADAIICNIPAPTKRRPV